MDGQLVAEISLRSGAAALLALLAISSWRNPVRQPVELYSIFFDVCAIAYLVETAPGLHDIHAWWIAPIRLLSMSTPAVYLVWAQAAFSDSFVPRWWRWLPLGFMFALALWAVMSDAWLAWRASQSAALLLAVAGICQALLGRAADLVEARRRTRLVFACGLGLCIVATTLLGMTKISAVPAVSFVLGLVLTAALLRLRVNPADEKLAPVAQAAPTAVTLPAAVPVESASAEERAIHDRLQKLLEEDRIYREGGLTVASLAGRLGVPEYRLRRLINQGLGHRNFVSFVNGYRLGEAMSALADKEQARVPVLTIALDAGFQSIGPFNRAFKAHTGETPTEFRARHLSGSA
jgi:AraC-like DNA-binding protein